MKLLWSTSFRSFGISNNNDNIQKNFLSSLVSNKFDLTLFVTQFGESGVEEEIKKNQLKYIYKDSKNEIPQGKKYSNKSMLKYSLEQFLKGDYDYYVHSTADLILPFNMIENLLKFKNSNTLFFVFPNTLVVNGKIIDLSTPIFGIDIFIFKIDKVKARFFLDLVESWEQYDWGVVDNFLISVSDKMKLEFVNLYKTSNIIKFENDFSTFNEDTSWQKESWIQNNDFFLNFLKKNDMSSLYAKGSYYYLAYKLFRTKDLNLNLLKCYIKLFFYFLYSCFKKLLESFNKQSLKK
jgi:hypothetical protein